MSLGTHPSPPAHRAHKWCPPLTDACGKSAPPANIPGASIPGTRPRPKDPGLHASVTQGGGLCSLSTKGPYTQQVAACPLLGQPPNELVKHILQEKGMNWQGTLTQKKKRGGSLRRLRSGVKLSRRSRGFCGGACSAPPLRVCSHPQIPPCWPVGPSLILMLI